MVSGRPNTDKRAHKRARKEEQAAQHEDAEDSDGAAASSSEAIQDQLVPAMQELDINALLENSSLAAKVNEQEITMQNQAATLNDQAVAIRKQVNVLRRFEKKFESVDENISTAVQTANVVQDQIGRYVGPVEKHGHRLDFIEAKQQGSGNMMLTCLQRMGEFTNQLNAVRAELAATNAELATTQQGVATTEQELAATNFELVETNAELAAAKRELAATQAEAMVLNQRINALQAVAQSGSENA
ncbi:hypothetical protein N0V85_005205 [Neurospora sp. IMI 360204]|nr:hypothetical protein N0V85_005205 [Neurospora sp. IMI 360204]